jgi:hypothetical protein
MTEFTDRVARAIFRIAPDEAVPKEARLATERGIAAMREATDHMMFAGAKALEDEMQAPGATLMGVGFAAMIDAALSDSPESS